MLFKTIGRRKVFISAFVFVLGFICLRQGFANEPVVRVAILKDAESFMLSVRGKYRIVDSESAEELFQGKRLVTSYVFGRKNNIVIGDQEYRSDHLRIITTKDFSIYLKDRKYRYRGQLDIILNDAGDMLIINTVDIEKYVRGVLYHEVPHYWPLEAIKTQAVATRTYALYRVAQRKDQPYDVTSDVYSQVYGGRSAERHRTNIAAHRTKGKVLRYDGKILPAYFHSTCGGNTENAGALWKHDLTPLNGVVCGFCNRSPHYNWKKEFRSRDIQDKLNANGFKLGLIKDISVAKRNASGRIKTLKVLTRDGKSVTIPGGKFREFIGPNALKSNNYDIVMKGYYFDVIGRGWGHGVGMCQWGTYQMSQQRRKYKDILRYYYPGSQITKISALWN